jgi:MYXO-CTERM domain-containing protein
MTKPAQLLRFIVSAGIVAGVSAVGASAHADTNGCTQGRCSNAEAKLRLEGRDALHTSIDTGWMPSCDNGVEHCNKGLQVRASIALSAGVRGGSLFAAELAQSAVVKASWEDPRYVMLGLESLPSADSSISITHTLIPQAELFVDIGIFEQGYVFPADRLMNLAPGARYSWTMSGAAKFSGWAFEGAQIPVAAPALADSKLFSVDFAQMPDIFEKIASGSVAIHARTSPTYTFKTTKVTIGGKDMTRGSLAQFPMPEGSYDFLEMPATIEAELSAKGEIEVMPSATLARLGDMNFNPPTTITFSSVKVTKAYDAPPQKYVFQDKTIRIPIPNVRRPLEGLDGEASLGSRGTVPALMENTGEAAAQVWLESTDPRFIVPKGPITIAPKSKGALSIQFEPTEEGEVQASILAKTNDPDMPELTFSVRATGVVGALGGPDGKKPAAGAGENVESGCGCKAAGGKTSSGASYAGLGLAALGLAAFARRRRCA